MPFCTKCGANVNGTFCSQCGTPVSAAAQAQPAAASPYGQPVAPSPAAPVVVVRKTSPVVWILVIVLGLFILGGIAVIGVVGFVAHRAQQAARQAGVSFDRGRDGGISIQTHGNDGKNATIEFGNSSGKLPSWVPVYPGSEGHTNFAMRGSGDGGAEGGNFTFTTTDDASKVKSFYTDKTKDLGMKVALESSTAEGSMMVAADEGGAQRSLTVIVGGHPGDTTVNVTYGRK